MGLESWWQGPIATESSCQLKNIILRHKLDYVNQVLLESPNNRIRFLALSNLCKFAPQYLFFAHLNWTILCSLCLCDCPFVWISACPVLPELVLFLSIKLNFTVILKLVLRLRKSLGFQGMHYSSRELRLHSWDLQKTTPFKSNSGKIKCLWLFSASAVTLTYPLTNT